MELTESSVNPLKIISLPCDDGGCGWYRIRQPFEMLKRFTPHDTHVISNTSDDMMAVLKALSIADVIVYRQGAEGGVPALKQAISDFWFQQKQPPKKQKWVLDIDDNIELISPYSEHYQEYGTQEVFDKNLGRWLWKDGESKFDLGKNRIRVESLLRGMSLADMITTTTEKLADYARGYNQNVAVLPNCVNTERWWHLNIKPNEPLRVGWSGGISHYEDWYSIRGPLNKLMREFKFKLIMVGSDFSGIIDEDNRSLVELYDWVPFKGHSYRMMCMALDFAIIPLANLPFNHYKSSVKWYEMSAMGIPSVVSNVQPYSNDVIHDKTGMLYKNGKEFYDSVHQMITRPAVRLHMGQEARKWVEINVDARKCADLWIKAYS